MRKAWAWHCPAEGRTIYYRTLDRVWTAFMEFPAETEGEYLTYEEVPKNATVR